MPQTIAELLKGDEPEEGLKRDKLDEIIGQLRSIANVDIRDMFDDQTGAMTSVTTWPDKLTVAISSINMHHAGGYNVKFYDKLKAAELLTKYESLLVEDESPTTPLDAVFDRIPREKLLEMKRHLDRMATDRARALEADGADD